MILQQIQLALARFRRLLWNPVPGHHGSKRSNMLRLAILSSSMSKVFGLALQAIAIPLVYRSLGEKQYALYLLMTGALATIAITQMGAGPGLTKGMAEAHARGDHHAESALFNAALRLTALCALIGGGVILAVLHCVPPADLFGVSFQDERATIVSVADVCIIVLIAQVIFGVVDSALAGYQEQVFSNIGSMSSNILSIGLLIAVCSYGATISAVIIVIYGVPILSRLVNVIVLFKRRPYLMRGMLRTAAGRYQTLLNVGLAFWVIQLGGLIEQHSGTYVLAHESTRRETVLFAIIYKVLTLIGSVNVIITQPLWPAFADAVAHRDFEWIRRSYRRIRFALTAFSCTVCVLLIALGPAAFRYFVHIDTSGSQLLFFILGAYFISNVWTHVYYVTLMGLPGIWPVALILMSENILLLLFALILVPHLGGAGMALAYLLASLVLPAWLLPTRFKSTMRAISSPAKTGSAYAGDFV
jgi:O-antigen/teichoic acid export membrane protein